MYIFNLDLALSHLAFLAGATPGAAGYHQRTAGGPSEPSLFIQVPSLKIRYVGFAAHRTLSLIPN